jgi:hypothetical protein
MRKCTVLFLGFFVTQIAFGQCTLVTPPIFPSGQTRFVVSSTAPGSSVGSPLFTFDANSFSIIDNGATPGGEPFFSITSSGQIQVLQDLEVLFVPRATFDITLTITAYNCFGETTETVDITVLQTPPSGTVPVIVSGQTRQTTTAAGMGDSVGDVLTASDTPTFWYIQSQNPDLGLFTIDNGGQIEVNADLLNANYPVIADIQDVTLTLVSGNSFGTSAAEDVLIEITRVGPPIIQPGQNRQISSAAASGQNVGAAIFTVANPETFNIESVAPAYAEGAFSVDTAGQLTTTVFLDTLDYPNNNLIQNVTVTLTASNEFGQSTAVPVNVAIRLVTSGRCPGIVATQTRYIDRLANVGDLVGEPIASKDIDSFWINMISIDPQLPGGVPSTLFTINAASGQIEVSRPLDQFPATIPPGVVTRLIVQVVGVSANPGEGCNTMATQDVIVYVLPEDASIPQVLPGQTRYIDSTVDPGTSVGEAVLSSSSVTNPPSPIIGWSITGGNTDGLFSINSTGLITTLGALDGLNFVGGEAIVNLEVIVFNDNGSSTPEIVEIHVVQPGTGPNSGLITFATNTTPIVITSPDHALQTGAEISVSNVTSPSNANGVFFITVLDTNTFELDGSAGNGNWVPNPLATWSVLSGGTTTTNFSDLILDDALRTCIQQRLGDTVLTEALILGLDSLDCSCRGGEAITTLSGMRFFLNLQELYLSNNTISDVTPLTGLNQLTTLFLGGNLITDITTFNPFATLTSMQIMDLSHNQIRDSYAFTSMANLEWLSLADNDVCDIQSLVDLVATGGLGSGDVINIDGNHLASANALNQIGILENAGVIVSDINNDATCPPARDLVIFETWPQHDVRELSLRFWLAPCP